MWKNIVSSDGLRTGDILHTSGRTWFFPHYAIVYFRNGVAYVTHCTNEGVLKEPLEEFEKKRTVYNFFRNEVTKKLTDKYIEDKSNELRAYGYNFMEMNCEDYVKRIAGTYIGLDDRVTAIVIISGVVILSLVGVVITLIKRR